MNTIRIDDMSHTRLSYGKNGTTYMLVMQYCHHGKIYYHLFSNFHEGQKIMPNCRQSDSDRKKKNFKKSEM